MNMNIYGLLIALAILIGAVLCVREERARKLPKDTGIDIVLYAVPPAIIGARLYYVLFAWRQFADNPLSALYVWEGGLAIYGGIIGGALGLYVLARRRKISYLSILDMAAPALLLGQAIGRWGNYVNQEAHGGVVARAALRFFPLAVQIGGTWYYATFFYEFVWNAIGFFLLYRKRAAYRHGRGLMILWYVLWYALGRMCIEGLRTDSLMLGNMRVSQALSLALYAGAALLLARRYAPGKLWLMAAALGVILCAAGVALGSNAVVFAGALAGLAFALRLYGLSPEGRGHAAETV